ncbi:MAG: hypothetical protein IJX80_03430 [Clostridia bacterium]|nr:hypothetical protein [Clostridia bacterium]
MENETKHPDERSNKKEEYEALVLQNKNNKKRFIKFLAAIGVALVLLFVIVVVVDISIRGEEEQEKDIFFYSPYEGNILEYEPYLGLDRKIYYYDGRVILSIEQDNLHYFDYSVIFLCDFIQSMIDGDVEMYNSYFTVSPNQAAFSPQMIYGTLITYESTGNDGNGDQLITYKMEYRIHRNDGTLRRDVGSDALKPQYIILRITEEGQISIDSLSATR